MPSLLAETALKILLAYFLDCTYFLLMKILRKV